MAGKIKIPLLTVVMLLLFACSAQALDMPGTNSYTYSKSTGSITTLYCPMPYLPEKVISFSNLKAGLQSPIDMCYDTDKNLYIVDSSNSCIVELDTQYKVKRTITTFLNNGKQDSLNGPSGMYVTKNSQFYICDTNNSRIVVLDRDLKLVKIYTSPKSELLGNNYVFKPLKITVDPSGNIYIINQNEFKGIMQLGSDGSFINFIGSNKVVFDPIDAFWKSIMTKEQRSQMLQFVPIEYTNISMDNQNFIYAVSASKDEKQPIKRLNLSGTDVLSRNGYVDITGDFDMVHSSENKMVKSSFTDITSDGSGVYYALDEAQGRIFTYNQDGYLLYVFGGMGNKAGLFGAPSAIEVNGDRLLVLDQTNNSLTVFKQTEYASLISRADNLFHNGHYQQSEKLWNEVLSLNSNFELAYSQIGSIYLENSDYKTAMKYFELGNHRGNKLTLLDGYNKAFTEYTKIFAKKYIGVIAAAVVLFIAALILLKKLFRRRRLRRVS